MNSALKLQKRKLKSKTCNVGLPWDYLTHCYIAAIDKLKERESTLKNDLDKVKKALATEKENSTKASLNDQMQEKLQKYEFFY